MENISGILHVGECLCVRLCVYIAIKSFSSISTSSYLWC